MCTQVSCTILNYAAYNFIIRNPLTGLFRKKSRQRTRRKRCSDFSLTPNERAASKIVLKYALLFTSISVFFAALAYCVAILGNL